MVFETLRKLIGNRYTPLNIIRIDKKRLINNYKRLCLINKNIKIAPVLKSNGYGHGIVEIAKILDPLNPPFFCVDNLFEAYKLYQAKINTKILIMGYVDPENLKFKRLPFSYAVYDLNQLKKILEYQPEAKVHLFIDTGMHREGILIDELENFIKEIPIQNLSNIEGLMSHLGASDQSDRQETKEQILTFQKATKLLNKNKIFPKWKHIANSAALSNNKTLCLEDISNLARIGLALYDSVLHFITHISQIKKINKNDKIGYDFTYTAKKNMIIAVLPVGYNDGVDRGLSNIGKVLIKSVICPIIGRVSMNITTIDVSEVKNIKIGDEVEIYFNIPLPGKILYELIVHLNPTIRRVIV